MAKKVCHTCQSEMIDNCSVTVQNGAYGIKISQKNKNIFNNISAITKAAVCPNCGNVSFYVEEYQQFKR